MKIKEKLIDPNPTKPIHDLDMITFLVTDLTRGAVNGRSATVIDVFKPEEYGYMIQVDDGEHINRDFFRHEFRPATDQDLERRELEWKKRTERREKREAAWEARKKPPEMPELGEDAFKIRK